MGMEHEARRRAEPVAETGAPLGLTVAAGAVLVVVAGSVAAAVPASSPALRYGVLAAAVAGFAAVSMDQVALAGTAVIGFAVFNGFLVNRLGELSWHGSADAWRLMALVGAGAVGLAAGEVYRAVRWWRERSWPVSRAGRLPARMRPGSS